MKRRPEHELLTKWTPAMTTKALRRVIRDIEQNSPRLIHGAFEDAQGGKCLASWFGAYLGLTGPEFVQHCGIPGASEVVIAWDENPKLLRSQILKALRLELFYRKGGEPCGFQASLKSSSSWSVS